jgi:arginine-tRNA-protein transferase
MYTIKCAALQFKPSRSQKKILKKFKHFIEKGEITASRCQSGDQRDAGHESSVADRVASVETRLGLKDSSSFTGSSAVRPSVKTNLPAPHPPRVNQSDISCSEKSKLIEPRRMSADSATSSLRRGGRKAKDIRRERWRQKQLARGMEVVPRPPRNAEKSLEERLSLARGPEARHVFEVRLVSTSSDAFAETFAESLEVYQKYQVAVHGDTVEKCSASQFKRFLCKVRGFHVFFYASFHYVGTIC